MVRELSTSGAVGIVVENVPECIAALKYVGTKAARRVATKALRAGVAPIVKAIRKEVRLKFRKKTGRLYKSPGGRVGKSRRRGVYVAMAGLNVGKKKERLDKATGEMIASGNFAPYAAPLVSGTKERQTKKGASRGALHKTDIIPAAYQKSGADAMYQMKRKLDIELQVEISKAYHTYGKAR